MPRERARRRTAKTSAPPKRTIEDIDAEQVEREQRHERDDGQRAAQRRPSQPDDRLRDDGDHDGLDPIEEPADLRQRLIGDICPGERQHDSHRWDDEAGAGEEESRPARAQVAQVDRQLRRAWPWDQVDRAEKVEEALLAQPLASFDTLLAHERDVRRRSAEGNPAEREEEQAHLQQVVPRRGMGRWFRERRLIDFPI